MKNKDKSVFKPYETDSFVKRNKDYWFNTTPKPVQDNKHNIYVLNQYTPDCFKSWIMLGGT